MNEHDQERIEQLLKETCNRSAAELARNCDPTSGPRC
jgi:hypothetical protein